jgi:AcrR family transcriptional regulator
VDEHDAAPVGASPSGGAGGGEAGPQLSAPVGGGRSGRSRAGAGETRGRILAAALATLRETGIAGISARGIARHGGFNQALIFYHFGSVEGLLIAVARTESERRSALYAEALADVTSLPELVAVARRLHDEEFEGGTVAALTQMMAGAGGGGSDELTQGIWEAFEPWTALVRSTIERLLADTPYASVLPAEDLTSIVAALFLGIELYTGIDPSGGSGSLFTTMESVARLVDALLHSFPAVDPPP